MSRVIRVCPGVGDRKCGAFLSSIDRDPHPTCTRCRGRICTMDITCDICADWSVAQWEHFVKKRSYKDRKKPSRPSGSVPPAPLTSPRAETSSGVSRPGTSSSSHPSGGQGKQEGSQGAPSVVSGGASSPPARSRSNERGGSASGQSSGARGRAPASPSGAGGVGAARSQQTPPSRASASVVSPHSSQHVRRRGESRETSESRPRMLSSRGSRSSDRGARKDRRARSRSSSSRGRRRRSRSLSSSRSRSRGRERRRRSSSRSLSSRARSRYRRGVEALGHVSTGLAVTALGVTGLLTATGRGVEALGHGETGLDPRIDTALGVTGRGLLTATGRAVSERVPLPSGVIGVTARGHTLSRVALVTARGHAGDYLAPLPARGQRSQDSWPDEKPRRVLRRLPLSLLRFLKRRWQSLLLQEGLL